MEEIQKLFENSLPQFKWAAKQHTCVWKLFVEKPEFKDGKWYDFMSGIVGPVIIFREENEVEISNSLVERKIKNNTNKFEIVKKICALFNDPNDRGGPGMDTHLPIYRF